MISLRELFQSNIERAKLALEIVQNAFRLFDLSLKRFLLFRIF